MLSKIVTPFKTCFRVCDSKESEQGNITIVEGPLSSVDVKTPNGYRYRKGFWDKVLSEDYVKQMIENRECLGTIEHPEADSEYMKTSYENASHVVLSVVVRNHIPYGRFGLLNNNKGCCMKALVDVGVPVGVSTRGLGDSLTDELGDYIDEENYLLITWDFTKVPNIPVSMKAVSDSLRESPLFKQLVEMHKLKDSMRIDAPVTAAELKKTASEIRRQLGVLEDMITKFQ